jgi:2-dehydropantoate 2-reductase
MKIGIIGAGAMGSLLGFYLCERADIWLLDRWQAHVDAINAQGLRCERGGAEQVRHPHAAVDPAAIGACDVALVLVKAHATAWATEQARVLCNDERRTMNDEQAAFIVHRSSLIVTLQNGIGNREILAAALGEGHVGQGVTSLGAMLLGPGSVRHAGHGPTIFGTCPAATPPTGARTDAPSGRPPPAPGRSG